MVAIAVYSVLCAAMTLLSIQKPVNGAMTQAEKRLYRDKVVDMFFHAYDSYMDFAYPADELMPLSCRGRIRGNEPSRGDIDDCLGSFSLTLIDSLDTLAVIGAIQEFNDALKLVIKDVRFNADLRVSVFETNIRVLGGLLGAHFAAEALRDGGHPLLQWYDDDLVGMAKTIGDKLLPAFNTTTGIPYGRINLKHGMVDSQGRIKGDSTCTACAGTMLMEFGALSRLTGDSKYETKARAAMEALWDSRHQTFNLLGSVINVNNGQWIKKDSGVGAGIDSYYEYCLKSYILFGDKEFLKRFDAHYTAIKQYVSNGPNLFEVNMNSPTKTTKRFMDSLLAFWPGLQVLWGDISSAVETHNMLYQATLNNKFLPESFSPELKPVWPQHPLRPEFIESTYFLYQATNDPYYLDVGRVVTDNLNKYAKVPCGFAAFDDLRQPSHEDRFDSYVLAETFKYLFLLFAEEEDLVLDMDDFIFTTEAHILPLKLSNITIATTRLSQPSAAVSSPAATAKNEQWIKKKPSSAHATNESSFPSQVCLSNTTEIPWADVDIYRKLLNKQCSGPRLTHELGTYGKTKRYAKTKQWNSLRSGPGGRLSMKVLDFGNPVHLTELSEMGISFQFQDKGKVILAHNPETAISHERAIEGKLLMQEVMKLMQKQNISNNSTGELKVLSVIEPATVPSTASKGQEQKQALLFIAGPAMFGPQLGGKSNYQVEGQVIVPTSPVDGCSPFDPADGIEGKIPLILRGGCMFIDKVRHAQSSNAIAVVIYDNAKTDSQTSESEPNVVKPTFPFSMSGDGVDDVTIPSLLISREDGVKLRTLTTQHKMVKVLLAGSAAESSTAAAKDSLQPTDVTEQQKQSDQLNQSTSPDNELP